LNNLRDFLKGVENQIHELPTAPSDDAEDVILSLISDFANDFASYMRSSQGATHALNQDFMIKIRDTSPRFSPYARFPDDVEVIMHT